MHKLKGNEYSFYISLYTFLTRKPTPFESILTRIHDHVSFSASCTASTKVLQTPLGNSIPSTPISPSISVFSTSSTFKSPYVTLCPRVYETRHMKELDADVSRKARSMLGRYNPLAPVRMTFLGSVLVAESTTVAAYHRILPRIFL
jgi:hypothetical protein